ncbi:MAG: hypothetical protein JWN25_2181 [Verrucomicrobiales bacterium]|jgi:hypothetical protein|nr:hypothetical protein [Verrucomicrobiales bacterium]MDB6130234.1 hypothetical protein [Verrucomicrobiales bacterium]
MNARAFVLITLVVSTTLAKAWDYDGHRMINQTALQCLPTNFPAFVKTTEAVERIGFLAGEPDRWRNTGVLPFKHVNSPDHFFDLEDIDPYHLSVASLSHFRYEFVGQMAAARLAYPSNFPAGEIPRNEDKTKNLVGFLPWTMNEYFGKLQSSFSYLQAYMEAGQPEEIINAQQDVIYVMGLMGHYVGDSFQPLHTTRHYNGWVGDNTNHFTTNTTFHAWIDGGYVHKIGISPDDLKKRIRPAQRLGENAAARAGSDLFPVFMNLMVEQHKNVVPLYQLNKTGALADAGLPGSEGRDFLTKQMADASSFLADVWYTAWVTAPPDNFLKSQLMRRKLAGGNDRNGKTKGE